MIVVSCHKLNDSFNLFDMNHRKNLKLIMLNYLLGSLYDCESEIVKVMRLV